VIFDIIPIRERMRAAYNFHVVLTPSSCWKRGLRRLTAFLFRGLAFVVAAALTSFAQSSSDAAPEASAPNTGRILLVLPFDNRTGQPNLEWIREAAPELLSSRFSSAGFSPMSREDRLYALDHLGLPQGFQPSRASSLKLAQTLDADSIIVGSYWIDASGFIAEAQVVDVPHLRMTPPVTERGQMQDLIAIYDSLAWKLTRELDPNFNVAEQTFVAAGAGLRLDAFEQYIRGITEPDQAERLRHLNQAIKLSPDYSEAWMALGREDYNSQQYEQAAAAFDKVEHNDPDALEAGFYRGLSLLYSGGYGEAEKAFAGVARVLPLAEVVNNEGVALSRSGRDGIAFYRQAETSDPRAPDYHFNIAVSLKRQGDDAGAMAELAQCLRLRPGDTEAQALERSWKEPQGASSDDSDVRPDPLERIERRFDATAFRQAAQMLDEMGASRLASLAPADRARMLAGQARSYLDRGLLLEAERLYQDAVAADSSVAEGHAGLAEVRERAGDTTDARKEAHIALNLAPSVEAYLVLGRLDLAENHLGEADNEAGEALKLDPSSRPAAELRRTIESRETPKP
jgi:tetratricopeptide (TPR) repeat protein